MRIYLIIWGVMLVVLLVFSQIGCGAHIYPYRGVSNVCGNGICDKGEDPENCRKDCPMPNPPTKQDELWPPDPDYGALPADSD